MEKLIEALYKKFGDKYSYLKLFDVVYDKSLGVCTVTFLFPHDMNDVEKEDREDLTAFIREFLSLNAKVRLKLRKSFLDGNLIIKEIKNFFEKEHKGVYPYIMEDNINVISEGFDVAIDISLNGDVLSMLDEESIRKNLLKHLNRNFIATFTIALHENAEVLPTEIKYVDIPPQRTKSPRYEVNIVGKLIGGDILPKPEYIKNNDKPKPSVIIAGTISSLQKKTYIRKHGKHKGEEGLIYSFNLTDEDTIEGAYFCSKTNERKMDSLQDGMMIIGVGDLGKGLSGKLTYYPKKISLASRVEKLKTEVPVETHYTHTQVVFPEPITSSAQATLFNDRPMYSDFILNNTIVVFDLETTGLDPETCEITELGAVKIVNGQVKEKFSTFVKPKSKIPEEVTKLTHITNEMVANAPSVENVIADFYEYTRGCIISGYNIVGFDMKFIKKAAAAIGLKFDNQIIDAFIVARQSNLRLGNYKLGTVVKALGLTLNDAHRAYNDAYATGLVLLEFNKAK